MNRLVKEWNGPKIGLALGGGGARGFAHLGVVKALRELNIPIFCVAGTSIGSIAGGIIASDMFQQAINWSHDPDWLKLPPLFLKLHLPWRSILASGKIESLLESLIPAKTFTDLVMPFAAVATDLFSGETVVMRSGDVHAAIRASMAIPGIFEPVQKDGRILVDGGVTNPVPVDVCRQMGAEKVIAVNINSSTRSKEPPPLSKLNIATIVDQTFTIHCDNLAREMFARERPECVLSPPIGNIMMFDFRGSDKLIGIGYSCAMANKEELCRLAAPEGTHT